MSFLSKIGETFGFQKAAIILTGTLLAYCLVRCAYNTWFHPLAIFPGPRLAAISNVYYGRLWLSGRYPWAVEKLFHKYGDIVRIAPNELVFTSPRAYTDIHASAVHNREIFTKTDFQDIGENEPGITAERDPEKHREIAKQLHPAFAARSLRRQEEIVHVHIDRFVALIERKESTGESIPVKEWFDWLAFDIAGEMAYGRQFENVGQSRASLFLSTFQRVGPWGTYHQVFKRFPLLHPLVWLLLPPRVVLTVPTLLRMNREKVRERLSEHFNKQHNDYINFLLPSSSKQQLPTEDWLTAQANVLIVAGFDPMTNLFSSTFYYLLRTPRALARLNEEIRGQFVSYTDIKAHGLQSLRYLHAVIEEALRIHTNAAFGQPRKSPGAMVDGVFIPKGVSVYQAILEQLLMNTILDRGTNMSVLDNTRPSQFHRATFFQS
jgi:cytochrome P450